MYFYELGETGVLPTTIDAARFRMVVGGRLC